MRFRGIVSYNGTKYAGWQIQPSFHTVQHVIQKILSTMHQRSIVIYGSGRTDAGVHAIGQVFHFDSDMNLDGEGWMRALNAQLPNDIRIRNVEATTPDFHARYSAIGKRYDYLVNTGLYDPFRYNLIHQVNQPLDLPLMREAASLLVGTHDFTSFCANTIDETPNQIRELRRLEIAEKGETIRFVLEGDGFLRYMVRMLVGNLLEVGLHKMNVESLKDILYAKDKLATSKIAPPCGLYLVRVYYRDLP